MKIFGLKFLVYLGILIQDGLAHMRGEIWQVIPAKFKIGMYEMKILGSQVLWCIFGSGWIGVYVWCHLFEMFRQSSKQGCGR